MASIEVTFVDCNEVEIIDLGFRMDTKHPNNIIKNIIFKNLTKNDRLKMTKFLLIFKNKYKIDNGVITPKKSLFSKANISVSNFIEDLKSAFNRDIKFYSK